MEALLVALRVRHKPKTPSHSPQPLSNAHVHALDAPDVRNAALRPPARCAAAETSVTSLGEK